MEKEIREQFQQYFGKETLIAAAPGRVNLIGEHTDYNEGFVLPGAIDRNIYIGIDFNSERRLNVLASQYQEKFSFALDDVHPVKGWPTYLLGMIYFLMPEKKLARGMDILVAGDIPVGAGMSSSAALCSAFGIALNEIFRLGRSRMDIALAAQKTEHEFAHVKCGIMDMFVSLHGRAGHLIKLDCRNLEYEYIPFDFPDHCVVLVNSMVTHSLTASAYNERRRQCEEGVAHLQKVYPEIKSLRDVKSEQLKKHRRELDPVVYKRCNYVLEENQRLLTGCHFLKEGKLDEFGKLMYASHEGLSKEYEVSCPESDFLVNTAKGFFQVRGARQMGGGFGGCMISLVEKEGVPEFFEGIAEKYNKKFGKIPDRFVMQIGEGAQILL
ncbi:MAG TPA: galactokinase [Puia sp.]|nr:galactokinase [Puia sp.]